MFLLNADRLFSILKGIEVELRGRGGAGGGHPATIGLLGPPRLQRKANVQAGNFLQLLNVTFHIRNRIIELCTSGRLQNM